MTRVLLYSPANLNIMDGSSIWVQSVAESLASGGGIRVVVPLKAPERRDLISGALRSIDGVEVLPPERHRPRVPPAGLDLEAVLDWVEALDQADRFDFFVLRGFDVCLAATGRERLRGRIWGTYILEPERDFGSAAYLADMAAIAVASEYVVCQTEEMRAVCEHLVPVVRGRTILLPPAISSTAVRAEPTRTMRRLVYTGKFHPFYPVPRLIDAFVRLRDRYGGLEFHIVGDKIWRTPNDHAYADALEARFAGTDGLAWHGAISRSDVAMLLAGGGIALSVWDHRHGSRWNDLVLSTKLLDYCAAGLPVVLNRTLAQEALLGADYPLFVDDVDEVDGVLDRLLGDDELYLGAAERCWSAVRPFTSERVLERLRPFLARPPDIAIVGDALLDRAKLPGASLNLGLRVEPGTGTRLREEIDAALHLLREVRLQDDRFRLSVSTGGDEVSGQRAETVLRDAPDLSRFTVLDDQPDEAAWLMTIGWPIRFEGVHRAAPSRDGTRGVVLPASDPTRPALAAAIEIAASAIVASMRGDEQLDRVPSIPEGRATPHATTELAAGGAAG